MRTSYIKVWLIVALLFLGVSPANLVHGQVNSWANPQSGTWNWATDANWLLGVAPSSSQSAIFITNAVTALNGSRFRTVTIDAVGAGTFPGTMIINNLIVSAPGSGIGASHNALFLNNAGLATPLHVLDTLTITSGGSLSITNSALDVGIVFSVDANVFLNTGTLITTNGLVELGNNGVGQIIESAGTWTGNFVNVGAGVGSQGTLTLAGGEMNLYQLQVAQYGIGTVLVTGGQLSTISLIVVGNGGPGQMTVSGGTVVPGAVIVGTGGPYEAGTLTLAGGTTTVGQFLSLGESSGTGTVWLTGGQLSVANSETDVGDEFGVGQMTVSNGTFLAWRLIVGNRVNSQGTLTVAGGTNIVGVVNDGGLFVGNESGSTGTVWITSGQLIVTNAATLVSSNGVGQMTISNGTWRARDVLVAAGAGAEGTLTAVGGTSSVLSNLTVGDCALDGFGLVFVKGGELFVTNATHNAVLDVRDGFVVLTAGKLTVDKLVMTNECGIFFHGGGSLSVGTLLLDPNLDADDDGLPNGWEQAHGLDLLSSFGNDGGDGDPDGDGFTNLQEYLAGSDPQNPLSTPLQIIPPPFQITSILQSGNNIALTWITIDGTTNQVQVTGGAGGNYATNGFTNLGAQMLIGGSGVATTNYLDVGGATNKPARYYRVRLVQ
jgi:hypothetical protein